MNCKETKGGKGKRYSILRRDGANFPCRRLSMIPERDISLTEQSPFDFSRMDGTRLGSFAVDALPYDDGSNHEATDLARGERKFRRSVFKSDFILAPTNSLAVFSVTANTKMEVRAPRRKSFCTVSSRFR